MAVIAVGGVDMSATWQGLKSNLLLRARYVSKPAYSPALCGRTQIYDTVIICSQPYGTGGRINVKTCTFQIIRNDPQACNHTHTGWFCMWDTKKQRPCCRNGEVCAVVKEYFSNKDQMKKLQLLWCIKPPHFPIVRDTKRSCCSLSWNSFWTDSGENGNIM